MKGIGPELPLSRDQTYGTFGLITSYKDEIRQNFKNLLLTSPGERVMNPDFGVGLRKFLFENRVEITPQIRKTIIDQTNKYLPYIEIEDVLFDVGEGQDLSEKHIMSIKIEYKVPTLNLDSSIEIESDSVG